MFDFANATNLTNFTDQSQVYTITQSAGVDPTVAFIGSGILLLLIYAAMWWFIEKHGDMGMCFFLLAEAGLMFQNEWLMSVKLALGGQELTLPFILFTLSIYEFATVFAHYKDMQGARETGKGK